MKTALCPGSFDPVTIGHVDIITRASLLFDRIVVLVSDNNSKTPSFTLDERLRMTKRVLSHLPGVEVSVLEGLLADYVRESGACAIVKGLRAMSDFEYEFQMALANRRLNEKAETVFLSADVQNMYLSSSLVKQIAAFGGDISTFVPKCILEEIKNRLMKRSLMEEDKHDCQ